MKLVGITGLKRSGKDTVGSFLEARGFYRAAFASPMKVIAKAVDPIMDCDGTNTIRLADLFSLGHTEDEIKAQYPEYRRFLQRLGTEAFRSFDENFWINWCFNNLPDADSCITDVRFPNEAERIKTEGGVVWRVERPGVENTDLHPSEAFIQSLPVDVVIHNDGTLEDLQAAVDSLLKES